jgi:tetratricopeptide (TPR) repeat protein
LFHETDFILPLHFNFSLSTFAQKNFKNSERNRTFDSLELLLKNAKEDTNKVIALNQVGREMSFLAEYNKGFEYVEKAKKLAEILKYKKGLAVSYENLGYIYLNRGDFPKALESDFAALEIEEALNDKNLIGKSIGDIESVYFNQLDFKKSLEYNFKALKIWEELLSEAERKNNLSEIGQNKNRIAGSLLTYWHCV